MPKIKDWIVFLDKSGKMKAIENLHDGKQCMALIKGGNDIRGFNAFPKKERAVEYGEVYYR